MKRFLLLSLACLTGVALHAKSDDLRLMTFNIRLASPDDAGQQSWVARKKACAKALEKQKPDLIGLQDAHFEHTSFLLSELKKYQLVDRHEKPGALEPILDANDNPILYRGDKFELLDYGIFWLNPSQTPLSKGWDASGVRNVTWVKLKFKRSGLIFFYFNTRFDPSGATARTESAKLTAEKIKEIAGDDAVVFFGGDLNMPESHKGMKPLAAYLQSARTSVKKADQAETFNGFGKRQKNWYDHLFFRNAEARSFDVIDESKYGVKYLSDHYPVCADFKISTPKKKR